MIVTTGNGNIPASATPGATPPKQLGQAVVRLKVQPDKSLKAVDFFMPVRLRLPQHLGRRPRLRRARCAAAGPVRHAVDTRASASRSASRGTSTCSTRPTSAGSDRDRAARDDVVQRLGPFGGAWSKPAVWGGDGGYVYLTTASGGNTGSGRPVCSKPSSTASTAAASRRSAWSGTSIGRVRFQLRLAGGLLERDPVGLRAGLGRVVADGSGNNSQLRAYDPVPVNGSMHLRYSIPIGQSSKFSVPVMPTTGSSSGPGTAHPQLRLADQRRR